MKHLLLVLLTLCASLSVRADELQSILQMLAARPLVRAEFSQEKTLPALKKPLHSEGQLVFAGKEGVLMFIRKPVAAQLAITPNVLLQKTARTQTRLRLDQSPYGAAAGIFSQLMSGDAKKLQSSFHVEALEKNGITWTLHLRPRDNRLQKLFRKLRISGDAYLRELHISDTSGGETLMRLTEHSSLPASLTDNERELLKLAH
ncbi:MAG: outer membrane lipoprotein carrier protein LolA [Moraxellaceae bacterium]|nr:outer membrane lipoprotein carrier protein LolA [Moraxellaceae bacterium]